MKKIIFALSTLMLLTIPPISYSQTQEWVVQPRTPDYSRPFMEPGSPSNPTIIRERWDGNFEIRSRYQDFSRPPFEPGSPSNPYLIKPVR